MKTPEKLAREHWAWSGALLGLCGISDEEMQREEYLYRTAFIHGYKHRKDEEDKNESQ